MIAPQTPVFSCCVPPNAIILARRDHIVHGRWRRETLRAGMGSSLRFAPTKTIQRRVLLRLSRIALRGAAHRFGQCAAAVVVLGLLGRSARRHLLVVEARAAIGLRAIRLGA